RIAIMALAGTIALTPLIDKMLWPYLWGLYLLSAFFSKYYTAPPFKLAYRGWGEVSVWFAFGPMAILIAVVESKPGIASFGLAVDASYRAQYFISITGRPDD
ncbi:MAG: hypothetical protein U5K51_12745, partial [Flavobacteriaceae bacterium]|nr:hypothetical protein [Flavobacteriaceae bacterium]